MTQEVNESGVFHRGIFKERAAFGNSRAMLEMYKLSSRKAMTSGAFNTVPDKVYLWNT